MTKAEAQTHLDAWLAADTALASGKNYTIGNRTLTRSDIAEVQRALTYWQRAVNTADANDAGVKNPGVRIATWN